MCMQHLLLTLHIPQRSSAAIRNPRLPATENEGRIIRGSTLFAARDHLGDPFRGCHFICDYNGITGPDWGLSELVFGKKLPAMPV